MAHSVVGCLLMRPAHSCRVKIAVDYIWELRTRKTYYTILRRGGSQKNSQHGLLPLISATSSETFYGILLNGSEAAGVFKIGYFLCFPRKHQS